MLKNRIISQYIFFQMVPSFILGIAVFISILLMFQALRLTEFLLIHGVEIRTTLQMMAYLSVSFLPAILPISLLFSILITYGRLSSDSEMVAMKSSGLSMRSISQPALILGILVTLLSAQTSFFTAPWGNRQFEVLYTRLGSMKAAITIREGTFSEGFFDLVVYANRVDPETDKMYEVFIYDERSPNANLTIVAQEGQIVQSPESPNNQAILRLEEGQIHRKNESHTVVNFNTYNLKLVDPIKFKERKKSMPSLTYTEIIERLEQNPKGEDRLDLETEYHKRYAISVACLIFSLLGVGLGTNTNRRNAKASGMVLSLVVLVVYWALYITMESTARSGSIPPAIAIWAPNLLFFTASIFALRKASRS